MGKKLSESVQETVAYPGGIVTIKYSTPEERMEKIAAIRKSILDA